MSVYFIRSAETPPIIKIGFSADVEKRVTFLLKSCPPGSAFMGYLPGARDLERHFHEMFKRQRLHGEWFEESDRLTQMIHDITIKHYPGREFTNVTEKLVHMDLMFAREASDALREVIATIGEGFKEAEVVKLLPPAMGLSQARFLAIRDCEVESVTAGEYARIKAGIDLAPRAVELASPSHGREGAE